VFKPHNLGRELTLCKVPHQATSCVIHALTREITHLNLFERVQTRNISKECVLVALWVSTLHELVFAAVYMGNLTRGCQWIITVTAVIVITMAIIIQSSKI